MPVHERVIEVRSPSWSFHSPHPFLHVGQKESPIAVQVAAAPSYPHSRGVVTKLLEELERAFPLPRPLRVYLPHFDGVNGTNGVTYDASPEAHPGAIGQPVMVLFGKATPIHPAVTRYLMAHEYGHAVADLLARLAGSKGRLLAGYLELRELPRAAPAYGPGTWHLDPEEILANDFRLLVARQELEFWPHPDTQRPEELPALVAWWSGQAADAIEAARVARL